MSLIICYTTTHNGNTWRWTQDLSSGRSIGVTTRDGRTVSGKYCREFRQNVMIDGRAEEAFGTACQQPNGDWQIVQNQ